jgi:predicted RNA-binding protein
MTTVSYNRVVSEIKELNMADQLRLLEEMAGLIRRRTTEGHLRSILELRGKGKQLWQRIGVQKYIDEERASWNG